MFKFKAENIASYRKNGAVYEIDIIGLDDEKEARVIKNLIKDFSVNRKVFADICGDMPTRDKEAVIRVKSNPRDRFVEKMEISPEKIDEINILGLLENMWTDFYFFRSSVGWEEFIEMSKVKRYFKQGDLVAAIHLRNLDGIRIEIGTEYSYHMDKLFGQLREENCIIKKRL